MGLRWPKGDAQSILMTIVMSEGAHTAATQEMPEDGGY